ncbi:hypothetical protein ACFZBU_35805 [Embleya sp. NPDC008237]|uniref:hypothetical protein n=1 Tax=Embleya sp. NPDC008237 TaxID=3363978 RepID=UPI0036EC287C
MFTDTDPFGDEEFERFEKELPGALRAAGDTFPGPSSDLVARGIARGRQRRRVRTLRRSAVAAVLVTASVAGWVTVQGTFEQSAAGPAGRTGSPWVTNAPRDLMPYLTQAVPAGGRLTEGENYFDADLPRVARSRAVVQAVYSDASGSSHLAVSIDRPGPGHAENPLTGTCAGTSATNECNRSTDPDGGVLLTRKTHKRPGSVEQEWRAVYDRADGARVDVQVTGRYLVSDESVGAPVLSMEQIVAIARSTSWEPVAAAVPTAAQQVTGLLPDLLPGSRVVPAESTSDAGEFVVETEAGTNGLNVRVEAGPVGERPVCPPDANGTAPGGSCRIVKLSDGTLARIDTERTQDGRFVPWALTAFRAHGLRIRFQANTPATKGAIERPGPVVIEEQIKTIAASPRWDAP